MAGSTYDAAPQSSVTKSVYGMLSVDQLLWKLDTMLAEDQTYEKQRYIVRLHAATDMSEQAGMNRSTYRAEPLDRLRALALDLAPEQVNMLLQQKLVASVEPDRPIEISESNKEPIVDADIKENSQTIPWGIHSILISA
ncbi:hypothetical protein [Paenibacillus sabuli]|uniref:hypothetical protein n=1 Tax=Paenibacillus sabuli TaxID=2772509 RepID=UPI00295B4BB8|nr:hypothetical protein [Paenibacillus sabuli]